MNGKKTVADMDWDEIEPIIIDYGAFGRNGETGTLNEGVN